MNNLHTFRFAFTFHDRHPPRARWVSTLLRNQAVVPLDPPPVWSAGNTHDGGQPPSPCTSGNDRGRDPAAEYVLLPCGPPALWGPAAGAGVGWGTGTGVGPAVGCEAWGVLRWAAGRGGAAGDGAGWGGAAAAAEGDGGGGGRGRAGCLLLQLHHLVGDRWYPPPEANCCLAQSGDTSAGSFVLSNSLSSEERASWRRPLSRTSPQLPRVSPRVPKEPSQTQPEGRSSWKVVWPMF